MDIDTLDGYDFVGTLNWLSKFAAVYGPRILIGIIIILFIVIIIIVIMGNK